MSNQENIDNTDNQPSNRDTSPDMNSTKQDTQKDQLEESYLPIASAWLEVGFYASIIAWISWMIVQTQGWAFEDRLFPRVLGSIAIILLVVMIFKVLFPEQIEKLKPNLQDDTDDSFKIDIDNASRVKPEREKYQLMMAVWVIFLPVFLYYIGFVVTFPLYLLAFFLFFLQDVKKSLILTIVLAGAIYVLFVVLLNVNFPSGELLSF